MSRTAVGAIALLLVVFGAAVSRLSPPRAPAVIEFGGADAGSAGSAPASTWARLNVSAAMVRSWHVGGASISDLLAASSDRSLEDGVRNEAMNALRIRHCSSSGAEVLSALVRIADDGNETARMRAFAIQHLSLLAAGGDATVGPRLRRYFAGLIRDGSAPSDARREALLAMGSPDLNGSDEGWEIVEHTLLARDPILADIAIRVGASRHWNDLSRCIEPYRQDPDPRVRALAKQAIAALGGCP